MTVIFDNFLTTLSFKAYKFGMRLNQIFNNGYLDDLIKYGEENGNNTDK